MSSCLHLGQFQTIHQTALLGSADIRQISLRTYKIGSTPDFSGFGSDPSRGFGYFWRFWVLPDRCLLDPEYLPSTGRPCFRKWPWVRRRWGWDLSEKGIPFEVLGARTLLTRWRPSLLNRLEAIATWSKDAMSSSWPCY